MRKSVSAFVIVTLLTSPVFAQKATRRASKKRPVARAVEKPQDEEISLDEPVRSPRETALRKVGITNFSAGSGITPEQSASLTRQLANDLTAMSYIEASPVAGTMEKSERAGLLKSVNDAGLDGVMIGVVTSTGAKVSILSKAGPSILTIGLSRPISLTNEAQVKAVSRAIVDEVARGVPYRGFVTRRVGQDQYEINLGKKHGIIVGQRFRLFDFEGATLTSNKRDICEVEVMEVSDTTAVVEPTGAGDVKLFSKVGFNENARGMAVAQQVETRGYARLGVSLLNISGSGDPKMQSRAYNVASAPGFIFGAGYNKWTLDILFAQAQGEDTDLVYTEVIANNRFYELPFGGLNRFSVLGGARVARVSISTKRNIISPLDSTTSISPEFEARLDRIIKGPVRGFVSASAYFPIYVSGMDFGAIIFSYGIGGDAGLSLDLTQRLFIDVGGRYHLIRRPVEGQTSVNETYTELFGDFGYRF